MKRAILLVVMVVLSSITATSIAAPSFADKREAQKLAREAAALAGKGDHDKAAKKYKKAAKLAPEPSYLVGMARSLVELGDLVRAAQVLKEAAELKPAAWNEKKAQKDAQKLFKEVDDRVPTLAITIADPSASKVTVKVNGDDFEPADGAVDFNPGKYEIVVTADGYETWTKKVKLDEGDEKTVEVTMKSTSSGKGDEESSGGGFGRVPAYVAWGVGAVGLGLGIGFGIAAIGATNEVLNLYECQDGKCPKDAEEDLDVAKANGNIATAGWAIAGAGAIAGTVLFIMADDGSDEGVDKGDKGTFRVEAKPLVGPGYIGVTGTF